MVEAFRWHAAPRYLLRGRDNVYGAPFRKQVRNIGIEEILIIPRSPWQNPYVVRLIGSVRREVLDHRVLPQERHLKRILRSYFDYYHTYRTYRVLDIDAPLVRPVHPPELGRMREAPEVVGLHHHYERRAA